MESWGSEHAGFASYLRGKTSNNFSLNVTFAVGFLEVVPY
jgi:hypothetical protein